MAVKPHSSGRKNYWIIDCWPEGRKGKRQRIPFHSIEAEARAAEVEILRSARQSIVMVSPTVSDLYPQWIPCYKNEVSPATFRDVISSFKRLLAHFGSIRVNHLSVAIIDQYKTMRLEQVKKRTINKELAYLSGMLNWAEERRLIAPLPVKIKGFPAKQARAKKPQPLSAEEISRVLAAIESEYKLVFLLMSDTGLRKNEALHLRAENVNLRLGLLRVTGKGGKEAVVPIVTDRLFEKLACRMDTVENGYLTVNPATGKPYYSIKKAQNRAAAKAGLAQHLHHHLLRHSFGTIAAMSGMGVHAIKEIMRHSDISTTMIYHHLAADFLKEETKKFNIG